METQSPKITPLTLPMLEVVTALAAEEAHSTAAFQGTAEAKGAADIPKSPNDYTPTYESQTSGGDEGLLDLYALNREVRRLKRQTLSQAKQIHKLTAKLKKLSKGVKPLVKHHILWVKSQKRGKKKKKKVSSVKLGRNKDDGNLSEEHHDQDNDNHKDEGILSEEHHDQDDHTAFVYEGFDATEAIVTPDFERKSPSSPIRPTQEEEPEEQFENDEFLADEFLADISLNISRPRGLRHSGPMQFNHQTTSSIYDPKEKGKGILVEEPKKKKLTLQQIRALETANDEEVARKVQAEWDAEKERKRLEDLKKPKPKTISKKENLLSYTERNQMMKLLKRVKGYENITKIRKRKAELLQERRCKEKRDFLRKRKSAQDRESLEAISMITDSRQDLYHLYLVVQDYYKHIPPTGLGLILLGDLTTIWETSATSDDDFWKNQEDWEIIRWRLNESSGVHTLELEDGTMLHMLTERRYPLSRELMIRMLDHGMEVEDESETAITLIHLFILWTTEDGDDS
ncbi:hypothetical protein Tco_0276326 [Tanacetum coccineum]